MALKRLIPVAAFLGLFLAAASMVALAEEVMTLNLKTSRDGNDLIIHTAKGGQLRLAHIMTGLEGDMTTTINMDFPETGPCAITIDASGTFVGGVCPPPKKQ